MSAGTLDGMMILTAVLVIGATLRLSRFVTTDTLGGWLLREPVMRWALAHERLRRLAIIQVLSEADRSDLTDRADVLLDTCERQLESDDPISWQARLASGIECPFCVGFWIGLALIAATIGLVAVPVVGTIWLVLLAALTLNYAVAHLASRID